MKKVFLALLIVSLFVSLAAAVFNLLANYHKTPEGALHELKQQTDAHILEFPMNNLVLLIYGSGDIAICFMEVERPFSLYKDFEILPTPLNIYHSDLENEIPYTIGPWYLEYTFGLIKYENVEYTAHGSTVRKDNVFPVFEVEGILTDADLSGVKLWYIPARSTAPINVERNVQFLDDTKELIEMNYGKGVRLNEC